MGGGQSTMAGTAVAEGYSKRATLAKKLSDDILTQFFTNANLKRLLNLHSLNECSKFVFTTAEELKTVFQKLKVQPSLGAKGEIYFTDIYELSPGLITDAKARNAEVVRRQYEKNTLCVDIAYYYVRIFQIYAALALTVIDADPTRRRAGYAKNPMQQGKAGQAGQAREAALQSGGAIAKSGPQANLYKSIAASPLAPFVAMLTSTQTPPNTESQPLNLSDKRAGSKGSLFIIWTYPSPTNELMLDGIFKRSNSEEIPVKIQVKKEGESQIIFSAVTAEGGNMSQEFRKSVTGAWEFAYDIGEGKSDDPVAFLDKIQGLVQAPEAAAASSNTGNAPRLGTGGPAPSLTMGGVTSFAGFDKLKKIFEDHTIAGKEFPKAYCVARVMTLLNPIFENELPFPQQPFYSQICRKKFDFESGMEDLMPRGGSSVGNNVYLKSLVALYYDDYKYVRGTNKMELTQTESGRSELRELSKEFTQLYMIQATDPGNFLSGTGTFKDLPICGGKDTLIQINQTKPEQKAFLAKLRAEVITPMLKFQEAHTAQVNTLLAQMFKIETKAGVTRLRLTDAIKSKGKDGINAFGIKAHRLLREYYRKSEAYYMLGVRMFENNKGVWSV
jgi:hypothetical protein